jgi:trans-aconitate methyltransferase
MKNTPWGGPKYRREPLPENDWATRFFDEIEIRPDMTVVHIGAAGRDLTARLAAAVPAGFVVGVEFDETAYRAALTDPRFADRERTAFVRADPCALPSNLPHGPFDVVVAHAASERCPNMTRLYSRYIRLVKDGGLVWAEHAADGDCADVRAAVDQVKMRPQWSRFFHAWRFAWRLPDETEIRRNLMMAAFAREQVTLRWEERLIPEEAFAEWLLRYPLAAYTPALPEVRHREFAAAVVRLYPKEKGMCRVERRIATVRGYRMWGELSHDLLARGPV